MITLISANFGVHDLQLQYPSLCHATENTAKQNTENPMCIQQYYIQPSLSCATRMSHLLSYSYATLSNGLP